MPLIDFVISHSLSPSRPIAAQCFCSRFLSHRARLTRRLCSLIGLPSGAQKATSLVKAPVERLCAFRVTRGLPNVHQSWKLCVQETGWLLCSSRVVCGGVPRYLVKSLKSDDIETLHDILQDYEAYIRHAASPTRDVHSIRNLRGLLMCNAARCCFIAIQHPRSPSCFGCRTILLIQFPMHLLCLCVNADVYSSPLSCIALQHTHSHRTGLAVSIHYNTVSDVFVLPVTPYLQPTTTALALHVLCRLHPSSLLCKFLLCVKLQLYSHVMYFVVMENLFPQGVEIHERYDLKARLACAAGGSVIAHNVFFDTSTCRGSVHVSSCQGSYVNRSSNVGTHAVVRQCRCDVRHARNTWCMIARLVMLTALACDRG